jgi:DNA mismatch repair protein MutS2
LKSKLVNYQELFDHNQRMIVLGNKLNDLAERFFQNNKKRPLIAELLRLVESENAKRKRKTAAQAKKDREVKKEVAKEVNQKLVRIRKEKKKKKATPPPPQTKPVVALKVGDKVRMLDGKSVGSIDAIKKQKAIVNYGLFTTQVSLDQLEIAN